MHAPTLLVAVLNYIIIENINLFIYFKVLNVEQMRKITFIAPNVRSRTFIQMKMVHHALNVILVKKELLFLISSAINVAMLLMDVNIYNLIKIIY